MPFDPTKPVRTRDGKTARIITTTRKGDEYPIVALVGGDEEPLTFTSAGRFYANPAERPNDYDLVNVPEQTVRYLNLYQGGPGRYHDTTNPALGYLDETRLGTVKATFEGDKLVSAEIVQ